MRQRYHALPVALAVLLGVSGCPVTDDYYLLSPDDPKAGRGGGSGALPAGGSTSQAGATGGDSGGSMGDAGAAVGGSPELGDGGQGGQPGLGEAGTAGGEPCVATTERCNGHDDDCDDVVDEFACLSNCSGFVLPEDPEHGYMFCTATRRTSWDNAKSACQAQDMRLAWLESAAENQAVAQKLEALGSDAEILFGATDQGQEGSWLWDGGEQFWQGDGDGYAVANRFSSWSEGVPNNDNNEDCALLNAMTGAWADRSCGSAYPYVCEQPD